MAVLLLVHAESDLIQKVFTNALIVMKKLIVF